MEFKITINAPREKVWTTLWDEETYGEWASAFAPGSKAETDWKKGSKVLFGDGNGSGMLSAIAENIPNEYMGIIHLGLVKDGAEDTTSDEAKKWAGAHENYTLRNMGNGTELKVEMGGTEIPKEFTEYFDQTWPKALQKLKELSEKE